ncbi:MAG: glycosyltransferase family 39 protein [Bacteroidales bacterium]|nr:glycosyltransferase family 39 protein [Bacteroidales bacterium]
MKAGMTGNKALWLIVIISALIRSILAGTTELGNDEAYYWVYALFPDWSHFDHPPMVGWIIQFFTLDMLVDNEFFIRLGAVALGSCNTLIIFRIGMCLGNRRTGLIAAILYNSSIYCFIIAGTFILPDTPLVFFWLLSLMLLCTAVPVGHIEKKHQIKMLLAGFSMGLAFLSKYSSVYLWAGLLAYIIFHRRIWLKNRSLYLAILITLLTATPVILWNIRNDFISISFHSNRVGLLGAGLRPDYLLMEITGEILYHNPVNLFLIISAIIFLARGGWRSSPPAISLLLWTGLPMIVTFILFSFFRRTLPHWSGPGYLGLILIAAWYLSEKEPTASWGRRLLNRLRVSAGVLLLVIILGYFQVHFGIIPFDKPGKVPDERLGKRDISLDLYGWEQIGAGFRSIVARDVGTGRMEPPPVVIHFRWFPAANLEYYACRGTDIRMLTVGQLETEHKYAWITAQRNGFRPGMDVYYITTSRDYLPPEKPYGSYFREFEPADTIRVVRAGRHVMNAFVYRLRDMKVLPVPTLYEYGLKGL